MATLSNTDLKNGTVFKQDGNIYMVLKYDNIVRGRGSSIVKVKVRDIESGNVYEKTFRDNETVEEADVRRQNVQYLFADDSYATFMNVETYNQFTLSVESLGDSYKYLKEGEKVIALYVDEKPVSIEIPKSIDLEVKYTEPAVKGNTATNAMKPAKVGNDLEVKVPLFIEVGDTVKINTESGEYISRVQQD